MTPDTAPAPAPVRRYLDLTGLPEEVVRQIEALAAAARPAVPKPVPPNIADPAGWSARLRAFIASRPRREGVTMDDSRESIYEWDGQ